MNTQKIKDAKLAKDKKLVKDTKLASYMSRDHLIQGWEMLTKYSRRIRVFGEGTNDHGTYQLRTSLEAAKGSRRKVVCALSHIQY